MPINIIHHVTKFKNRTRNRNNSRINNLSRSSRIIRNNLDYESFRKDVFGHEKSITQLLNAVMICHEINTSATGGDDKVQSQTENREEIFLNNFTK